MQTATLTSKFQICIPKGIRERLHLEAGQQFVFLSEGETIRLVPRRSPEELRGLLRGANPEGFRDRKDRP
jgi:AbrB family looped-hinge helix DNA binding protein